MFSARVYRLHLCNPRTRVIPSLGTLCRLQSPQRPPTSLIIPATLRDPSMPASTVTTTSHLCNPCNHNSNSNNSKYGRANPNSWRQPTNLWAPMRPCWRNPCLQWVNRRFNNKWPKSHQPPCFHHCATTLTSPTPTWFVFTVFHSTLYVWLIYIAKFFSTQVQKLRVILCPFLHKAWRRMDQPDVAATTTGAPAAAVSPTSCIRIHTFNAPTRTVF
jgi:hypothetical protein